MQRIIWKLDELNSASLKPEEVRTATMVRLPFRLCTGCVFRFSDPDQNRVQVWLRNKLSIPHDADGPAQVSALWKAQHLLKSPEGFLTDALLVDSHPRFRSGEFDAIRTNNVAAIGCASPENPGFRILNELIAAHQMVRLGPYVSALGSAWPRMLSEREMFSRIIVEVILIASTDRALIASNILQLFDHIDRRPLGLPSYGVGDICDFSGEQLSSIERAVNKLRNHAFYELRTNAVSAMLAGDSVVGIVLACAALEGAHGAFLRIALRDKVPGEPGNFNEFMSGLLRDQGFYSLVQLSSRVLMTDQERPTEDELKQCLEGVTIRNAIMHAGIKKSGQYKLREFSRSEIDRGYRGIMAVYRSFEGAVEARSS